MLNWENKLLTEIDESKYYVYEHYLDDELFYIGKGIGKRCLNFETRSALWKYKVGNRIGDVIVKIVKMFNSEKKALSYEKKLILEKSKQANLVNITYNRNIDFALMLKSIEFETSNTLFNNLIYNDNGKEDKISNLETLVVFLNKLKYMNKLEYNALVNSLVNKNQSFIYDKNKLDIDINLAFEIIDELRYRNDENDLFLSDIIETEKPVFGTNNLILAPVGSGKTTLINNIINSIELKEDQKVLMLVSNRFLKDSIYEYNKEKDDKKNSFSIATTKSLKKQKNENSKVHLMTYHEFSYKIQNNNEFMNNIVMVFCDEIHSLPEYRSYISNKGGNYVLEHSIKYLFSKHNDKQIFYFTATDENLLKLEKKRKSLLKDVITFDYRKHPDIKQYMELSKSFITHIEQVRPFLKSRLESFEYFKHKGVAFTKTITSQKVIERILIEEGFKPLVLWSDNNNEHPLSEEQISARTSLIKDGKIPEPYNFLIMNSALREGWNLYDSKVKLAIMNTTTETDLIQARGRVRRDIDLVIYKTTGQLEKLNNPELVEKYLNKPLTTENKEQLCIDLNLKNNNGRLMKWRAIKELLEKENYILKNSKITIEGKRVNVTIITPPL